MNEINENLYDEILVVTYFRPKSKGRLSKRPFYFVPLLYVVYKYVVFWVQPSH